MDKIMDFLTDTSEEKIINKYVLIVLFVIFANVYLATEWFEKKDFFIILSVVILLFSCFKLYKIVSNSSNPKYKNKLTKLKYDKGGKTDSAKSIWYTIAAFYYKYKKIINISVFFINIISLYYSFIFKINFLAVINIVFLLVFSYNKYKSYQKFKKENYDSNLVNKKKANPIKIRFITRENLFFNFLILAITMSVIKYYDYLSTVYLAVFVFLTIFLFIIYLINRKIFVAIFGILILLFSIVQIFNFNITGLFLDTIFIIGFVMIFIKSKQLSKLMVLMDGDYIEGRMLNKKINKISLIIKVVSVFFIYSLIYNLKIALMKKQNTSNTYKTNEAENN